MGSTRLIVGAASLAIASYLCSSAPVPADDSLAAAARAEATVNWYGVWPKDLMDRLTKVFETRYPGIKVNVFRSGSSKVAAKIEAEMQAGKVLADVMTISEESIMTAFKNKGYLEPYKTAHFDKFRPEYRDADGYWITPRVATVGLWYNVDRLAKRNLPIPTSWHDLANPIYRGEIALASPLYSGIFSSLVGTFSQKETFGWDYFRRIAANEPLYVADVPDVARAVAGGQKTLGPVVLGYVAIHPLHPKGSIAIVSPKEGVLVIQSSTALLKARPHSAGGKLLQNFLTSIEAAGIIRDAKYLSGRADIEPPQDIPPPQPALFPDANWLEKYGDEIRKNWADITGQS